MSTKVSKAGEDFTAIFTVDFPVQVLDQIMFGQVGNGFVTNLAVASVGNVFLKDVLDGIVLCKDKFISSEWEVLNNLYRKKTHDFSVDFILSRFPRLLFPQSQNHPKFNSDFYSSCFTGQFEIFDTFDILDHL